MNLNVLKGLLIILVIVDHNEFSRGIFSKFFDGFSFHVIGFMALPFLRDGGKFSQSYAGKHFFRLYYPFFIFACLTSAVVLTKSQGWTFENIKHVLWALYSADALMLKKTTSMALLWFLPCLFSLLVVKSLIATCSISIQRIAFLLFLIAHISVGSIGREFRHYSPLGLLAALYIIPLCYVAVYLHRCAFLPLTRKIALAISVSIFCVVKYWQISLGLSQETGFLSVSDYTNLFGLFVNDLEAVAGTVMMFQASRFNLGSFFEKCGKYSMQIYLLHAFLALIIYKIIVRVELDILLVPSFILSIFATILFSALVAEVIMKNRNVNRFIFPRDYRSFIGYYHKFPYVAR